MTPDDLTSLSDEDLYILERQRSLDPESLARIDDELRRRRESRRASLADIVAPSAAAPIPPTLGDLERVAAGLEATVHHRLAALEARVARLRWWAFLSPLLWIVVGAGVWIAITRYAPDAARLVTLR